MYWVRWNKKAREELANRWLKADSTERQRITAASAEIDKALRSNPHEEGESRSGGRRLAFFPPLAVIFQVEADDRTVSVLEIGYSGKRKP